MMITTAFHTGKKFAVFLCSTKVLDGKVGDRYSPEIWGTHRYNFPDIWSTCFFRPLSVTHLGRGESGKTPTPRI